MKTKNNLIFYAKKYIPFLFSIFGTLSLYLFNLIATNRTSDTIINLLLPLVFIWLYTQYSAFRKRNLSRRQSSYFAISAFLLSLILFIGHTLDLYSSLHNKKLIIFGSLCGIFLIIPILVWLKDIFIKIIKHKFTPNKHFLLASLAIIIITNLIYFIVLFPGIYTYDMAAQNEMISTGDLNSHWSLVYGYIFAFFLDLGNLIFHNFEAGLAIMMFLQLSLVSFVEYLIIKFVAQNSANKILTICSLLFFVSVPFFGALSVTAAQDVLFGCLFIISLLEIYKIINAQKVSKKHLIIFTLSAFSMTTIRNNGIYALLIAAVIMFFVKEIPKLNKRLLIIATAIAIILSSLYSGPLFSLLGVRKPTTIREMMSVPSQQLARAYLAENNNFTPDESEQLSLFYNLNESFADYMKYPLIADYTKDSMNTEYVSRHFTNYIALYLNIAKKNPVAYIEAFLLNSFGFWYPNKDYNDSRINLDYMNYPGFTMTGAFYERDKHPAMKPIEQRSISKRLTSGFMKLIFNRGWQKIPFVRQLSSMGNYFIILLLLIIGLLYIRSFKGIALISPVLALELTLFLAPVAIFRYAYPIALSIPIIITIFIQEYKSTHRRVLKSSPDSSRRG